MLAKFRYHHQPPPTLRDIAQAFRLFGWTGFWVQLIFAFISRLALLCAASGRSFSPDAHPGIGIGIFWGVEKMWCSRLPMTAIRGKIKVDRMAEIGMWR